MAVQELASGELNPSHVISGLNSQGYGGNRFFWGEGPGGEERLDSPE